MLSRSQKQLLVEGARLFQVILSEEAVARFATFIEEIQRWSKIANLLSQTDTDTLIRKHIVDSLSLFPHIPAGNKVLDLGSGAGFPGIPIAISSPDLQIFLIEARRKRANFLKETIRTLNLHNTEAYEGRVEQFSKLEEWKEKFDVATTRATWNISTFLPIALPFLRQKGVAMAMKGPKLQEELRELARSRENQNYSAPAIFPYSFPGNKQRTIAIFKKMSP